MSKQKQGRKGRTSKQSRKHNNGANGVDLSAMFAQANAEGRSVKIGGANLGKPKTLTQELYAGNAFFQLVITHDRDEKRVPLPTERHLHPNSALRNLGLEQIDMGDGRSKDKGIPFDKSFGNVKLVPSSLGEEWKCISIHSERQRRGSGYRTTLTWTNIPTLIQEYGECEVPESFELYRADGFQNAFGPSDDQVACWGTRVNCKMMREGSEPTATLELTHEQPKVEDEAPADEPQPTA